MRVHLSVQCIGAAPVPTLADLMVGLVLQPHNIPALVKHKAEHAACFLQMMAAVGVWFVV